MLAMLPKVLVSKLLSIVFAANISGLAVPLSSSKSMLTR